MPTRKPRTPVALPAGANQARLPHPRVRTFGSIEDPRRAPLELRGTHNATRPIERPGFGPPDAVRQAQLPTAAIAA